MPWSCLVKASARSRAMQDERDAGHKYYLPFFVHTDMEPGLMDGRNAEDLELRVFGG